MSYGTGPYGSQPYGGAPDDASSLGTGTNTGGGGIGSEGPGTTYLGGPGPGSYPAVDLFIDPTGIPSGESFGSTAVLTLVNTRGHHYLYINVGEDLTDDPNRREGFGFIYMNIGEDFSEIPTVDGYQYLYMNVELFPTDTGNWYVG